MPSLFEPTIIRGMSLSNRFVRSATWEGLATKDGATSPRLIELMGELAQGGVGLIITGHAYIRPEGQAGPWQLGIYKDEFIPGLQEMAKEVHQWGGRIVLQITHAGLFANLTLIKQDPIAPSLVEDFTKSPVKEMTIQDIKEVVEAFGQAAERATKAGFDGVQIHAAHGYLLSQFLSPLFNRRRDPYGGSFENRARALLEVLQRIRKDVGPDYPILVKMNSEDFLEGGLTLDESSEVGRMLCEAGIDAIELSGGTRFSGSLMPARKGIASEDKEAYFEEAAKVFKRKINVPLILVGGIRSYHVAERLVEEGVADYISMSRPLIREPGLINRWKSGDLRKATCISDNRCDDAARAGEGIYCVVEKRRIGSPTST